MPTELQGQRSAGRSRLSTALTILAVTVIAVALLPWWFLSPTADWSGSSHYDSGPDHGDIAVACGHLDGDAHDQCSDILRDHDFRQRQAVLQVILVVVIVAYGILFRALLFSKDRPPGRPVP